MAAATLAALAALVAVGAPAHAASRLRQLCVTPPGREWASFAYDPAQKDAVLFGGANFSTSYGDTWTWNGACWTRRHPAAAPSARTGAAMVWDGATQQLLLFGGSTKPFSGGGYQADTWTWNGATWKRLHPAVSPPARHNADLVYDQARHRVILFGGYDGAYLGDTWAWNGSTWTQLNPAAAPSARDTDSLAYDAASQRSILFGGFNDDAGRLGDTWAWNGSTWTQLNPATSPGVVSTAWQAAYDRASRQLVVFGGDPGLGTYSNDTWTWDGSTWIQQSPANSPAPRAYGSMTYDRALHRVVLFGGSTIGAFPRTTWEWDGSTWRRR